MSCSNVENLRNLNSTSGFAFGTFLRADSNSHIKIYV